MKTILLYGHLGKQFGRVHHYNVSSAAEAVRALCVTLDEFRKALIDGGAYRVLVGGREPLSEGMLINPISKHDTLRIVPVISGAGNGVGQTILGAIMIVASFIPFLAPISPYLRSAGIALILGGVAQMLFTPAAADSNNGPNNTPSYAFDGVVNTTRQGNPIPVLYGRLIVGSQVASAGLSVEQQVI